jgi:ABC-type polysaccharide/polyol phosphate transport system ATPase subunit
VALSTSSDGTIRVERVWKRFRRDRARPFLGDQVRALGRRVSERDRGDGYRWVLRDVDFTVEPGEAVAVVGSNGAGKSTLLKVLTRVMYPYAGRVDIAGRVGAIIELRGGMHPELSGRENIFMYGTLLGLPRPEIARRFDEIVEFADLSQAIDRAMKYYSSGMQMRLGFAIAAFLRPDVLLVDEVLAVGDAWFQQRCLDRMREVLHEGTTLVLVSHDLASVEATCTRGLWIDNGVLVEDAAIRPVLAAYRQSVEDYTSGAYVSPAGAVRLVGFEVARPDGGLPTSHADLELIAELETDSDCRGRLHIGISEGSATPTILVSTSLILDQRRTAVHCTIDNLPLPRGRYSAWVHLEAHDDTDLIPWHPAASFQVAGSDLDPAPRAVVRLSPVHVLSRWSRQEPRLASPPEVAANPGRDAVNGEPAGGPGSVGTEPAGGPGSVGTEPADRPNRRRHRAG